MNGLFINYNEINNNNLSGIDKKVLWQIEALQSNGSICKLVTFDKNGGTKLSVFLNKILVIFPFTNTFPKWEYIDSFSHVDFIYMRRPTCFTMHTIKILKRIKTENPECKIILELPTFPYDKELLIKFTYLPIYIKDRVNRRKLKKYVDRVSVQNSINEIFGIPTLKFKNGIKVDDITKRVPKNNNKVIHLCAVASLNAWQGYERVIKGLSNYYNNGGTEEIIIHIVGSGSELERYKKLVSKLNLNNNFKFYGKLFGKELEKIYNLSDIGLDAFGRYKTNNKVSTSLKSREYLAKGLPIVSGCEIDVIEKDFEYYLEFESDNSSINFEEIVSFYRRVYKKDKVEVSERVREYAYLKCDMGVSMSEVIDYIN